MQINIDKNAGFCFGVEDAVNIAEKQLEDNNSLLCLGDIVHNDYEINRLKLKGVNFINNNTFKNINNKTVMFRAHGEHPNSYKIAKQNNIKIIDATCPIVLNLQKKIRNAYENGRENEQIVIYGKNGHAEAVGLSGQINDKAIIIESIEGLENIDFSKPITIFSQTTMSNTKYLQIVDEITRLSKLEVRFNKTVCGQVSYRDRDLEKFAKDNDIVIFVSGKKSSNGKMLFQICKNLNLNSYFVSSVKDIKKEWFPNVNTCGISGATSTPLSQINEIKQKIESLIK